MINDVKIRAVQLAKETGSVKRLLDQVSLKTLCMHGQKPQGRDDWTSVPAHMIRLWKQFFALLTKAGYKRYTRN